MSLADDLHRLNVGRICPGVAMKTATVVAIGHGYRPTYDDGRDRPDFTQAVDAIEAAQIDALEWTLGLNVDAGAASVIGQRIKELKS